MRVGACSNGGEVNYSRDYCCHELRHIYQSSTGTGNQAAKPQNVMRHAWQEALPQEHWRECENRAPQRSRPPLRITLISASVEPIATSSQTSGGLLTPSSVCKKSRFHSFSPSLLPAFFPHDERTQEFCNSDRPLSYQESQVDKLKHFTRSDVTNPSSCT